MKILKADLFVWLYNCSCPSTKLREGNVFNRVCQPFCPHVTITHYATGQSRVTKQPPVLPPLTSPYRALLQSCQPPILTTYGSPDMFQLGLHHTGVPTPPDMFRLVTVLSCRSRFHKGRSKSNFDTENQKVNLQQVHEDVQLIYTEMCSCLNHDNRLLQVYQTSCQVLKKKDTILSCTRIAHLKK